MNKYLLNDVIIQGQTGMLAGASHSFLNCDVAEMDEVVIVLLKIGLAGAHETEMDGRDRSDMLLVHAVMGAELVAGAIQNMREAGS